MVRQSETQNPVDDDRGEEIGAYASPPCYQHELDPSYERYLDDTELAHKRNIARRSGDLRDQQGHPGELPGEPDGMDDWEAVRAWRKRQRARLLEHREGLSSRKWRQLSTEIIEVLRREGPPLDGTRLGFYWPLLGEVDLRPFIRDLLCKGVRPALPVIIGESQPLEYWRWDPKKKLCSRGLWRIPAPVEREVIRPMILFVPLLGFDGRGHRLGHGGGYYDRTLSAFVPRPLAIGVGYEFARLATIYPQQHDVPMDAIVTEAGITWHAEPAPPLPGAA